ncbi:glycosyltransferase family 1 protein [Rossellomorea aquimaris]|uniref:glycosyltransferase family 1 protein n=1 Tax=Rossellomorea aquimaris TaxID=189382 RepID=UPI001CD4EE46|nr:glycosyltransferase family 1 protein [Rossellomorea aquimaris]MCA1061471.1 glycosyltransferase family 1 protein [Rossellomorea aquimaris]
MDVPKRILHIVGAMNRAGTETMLMNLYRNINHHEIQFDFVSYSEEKAHYDHEIIELGGKVIRLSQTGSIMELYQAIKQNGPYEAVHSHTLFHCGIASAAAYLAGVKIRISHAHTTEDNEEGLVRRMYITAMRKMIKVFSTHLLACSKEAGEYLFGAGAAHQSNYSYFPNVIEFEKLLTCPPSLFNQFKIEEGLGKSIVIGHIGRFIPAKNHDFLLDVMKSLIKRNPNCKLLLVGEGDLKKHIEKRIENEGLKESIRLVGIREDIGTMLHSMDVFVFPSLYEGLGLVLLEAQASGLPCVVSEAIQPEADLQIGLVTQLQLRDGPEVWAGAIVEQANRKEKNLHKIKQSFERNDYSPEAGISKLMTLYGVDIALGGSNEKSIDRFV